MRPDGNIERQKARLVAREDKQLKGKDYKHAFSPVAKFASVRILIALVAMKNEQLDINNTFLHGYVEEEIYTKPPLGYIDRNEGKFCKLHKSLYGLKQASRQWNIQLKNFLLKRGFVQLKRDYSLFCRQDKEKMCIVLVYVDDLLISGDNEAYICTLKQDLHTEFTYSEGFGRDDMLFGPRSVHE